MPIRGPKNAMPKKGGSPTGIFSTNGKQKQDGATGPHMDTVKYAHRKSNDLNGHRSDGLPKGNAGDRHQTPRSSGSLGGRNAGTVKKIPL